MHSPESRVSRFWRYLTCSCIAWGILTCALFSLLTVGRTVDEAAILYSMLDNACHSQLLAEAAAANGIPKRVINNEVAQYTADFAQNPVSLVSRICLYYNEHMLTSNSTTCTPSSSLNLTW